MYQIRLDKTTKDVQLKQVQNNIRLEQKLSKISLKQTGRVGASAYQVWLNLGNTGSEADYLASLKGDKGDKGDQGLTGAKGDDGIVQSIVAGANVTVDDSDPANPIVSATGGGGVSEWGDIDGTLSDQTDLQNALNAKADTSSLGSAAYGDVVQGLGVSTADAISQDAFTTILGQTVSSVNGILLNKVDKVTGKGLSTNDYTDTDRDKLAGIEDKVGSDTSVSQVIALTQAEYDAIVTKDPTTLYFIKDL